MVGLIGTALMGINYLNIYEDARERQRENAFDEIILANETKVSLSAPS